MPLYDWIKGAHLGRITGGRGFLYSNALFDVTSVTYHPNYADKNANVACFAEDTTEELRIRCEALRGLLYAECGFELDEIDAVEEAALWELFLPDCE